MNIEEMAASIVQQGINEGPGLEAYEPPRTGIGRGERQWQRQPLITWVWAGLRGQLALLFAGIMVAIIVTIITVPHDVTEPIRLWLFG